MSYTRGACAPAIAAICYASGPAGAKLECERFSFVIVSHRHRFVFLAVPRTATHAVRAALAPALGDEDWQQEALLSGSRSPLPPLARIGHGHVSAREAEAHLPASVWRRYFKFAFVRDPYDRFVSICAMLNKRHGAWAGRETAFMKLALATPRFRARVLAHPQSRLLEAEAGVDFVGRFETLQCSFNEVCRRVGIAAAPPLPQVNQASHRPYHTYYDDALVEAVTRFYQDDFTAFGYPPSASAGALACA